MSDIHLLSPRGFRAGGVACGLKESGKLDLGLLVADGSKGGAANVAAAFTRNKVEGGAVTVGKRVASGGKCRAVVVNSGNSNSATGTQGVKDAQRMARLTAEACGFRDAAGEVIPSSTGIIGVPLPMAKVAAGIADASAALGDSAEHAGAFAQAILTTDLVTKTAHATFRTGGGTVTVAGVCKGSGMIGPILAVQKQARRSATMLAFLTTDADVSPAVLRRVMTPATDRSFNRVTIEGHASTCDTSLLLASRRGPRPDEATFQDAVTEVCQSLAQQIAADGEGATKKVNVRVTGCASERDADMIARTVAASPLVKTALHGNDPNWGRIVSAAGYADAPYDWSKSTLDVAGHVVFRRGKPVTFDEAAASDAMKGDDVTLTLDCGSGKAEATVWTCDLSREYITINADYTT